MPNGPLRNTAFNAAEHRGVTIRRMSLRPLGIFALVISATTAGLAAQNAAGGAGAILLRPARVFDGETMHEGWAVRVVGERIDAAGPGASLAAGNARVIDLAGLTLTPGLVEGH